VEMLGGRGVPMPSAQLPFAIAGRVVDGCIIPWDMVPALKLDELLKAHTDFAESSLSTTTSVLAMNKTSYEELPTDLKKIVDDNSRQAAASMAGTMWDLKARAVADAVSQGGDVIVTLEPEAVVHWRSATEPVIEAWRKQMKALKIDGEKLLVGARTLIEKYANVPAPQPPQQPTEAKAEKSPPAKAGGAAPTPSPAAQSVPQTVPKVSVMTPATPLPPASSSPTHWWQFWKSSSGPATASAAPPAPTTHWWQFWRSASQPVPATASAAPVAPPTPSLPALPTTPPVPKPAPVVTSPPNAAIVKPAAVPPRKPPSKTLNIPL
jgi:hypothetical protein